MHHGLQKLTVLVAFLVCLLTAGASVAQSEDSADSTAFRFYTIRPFGDSITVGGGQGGYRSALLVNQPNKGPFVLVGGSTAGSPPWMFYQGEQHHDGYSGLRINELWNVAWQSRSADIILVHAGTNDIWQGADAGTAAQRLDHLLRILLVQNHRAMILVAKILPMYKPAGRNDVVREFNDHIPGIVAQFRNWGRIVRVVDMHSNMPPSYFHFDGVHPTAAGFWQMAERWKNAINALPPLPVLEMPDFGEMSGER